MSALPASASAPLRAVDETPLRIVVAGHVDHGKSTLIGRLLNDVGALPEGKVAAVAASSQKRGMPFEWAFVTDALKAERDQGITIDVSHIWFHTDRPYLLLDAPGHREFLRNMITGAAASDAGLLVIDAVEGMREQSRRHATLLSLLGLRQIAVAVNKMDLVERSETRFSEVAAEIRGFFAATGIEPRAIVPVAARDGGNLVARDAGMDWYSGPTVMEALDGFTLLQPSATAPLRLPVQDVYKFDARRIVAGRIESGRLAVGDRLVFSPSNKAAVVASLEAWGPQGQRETAEAGESVGLTLDPPIFIERGEIAAHESNLPKLSAVVRGRIFWFAERPLRVGGRYRLKLTTREAMVEVEQIERVVDTTTLEPLAAEMEATLAVPQNALGEVILRAVPGRLGGLVALDDHDTLAATGRFVLLDGYEVVGAGLVDQTGYPDERERLRTEPKSQHLTAVEAATSPEMRTARNGHRGGVLWFTGLSGAGKSTLAVALERHLFQRGYQVYVLDGDNVRRGLNSNLGFSPDDRLENIRRVGEVAALFADAGILVLTAFISPYRSDRDRARQAMAALTGKEGSDGDEGAFHEIHIAADLATCEERDPKGLYKLARSGEIAEFTGISAPYEPPLLADLTVDTGTESVEDSLARLLAHVEAHFPIGRQK